MKDHILILCRSDDKSVDGVIDALRHQEENIVRFNIDQYPGDNFLTLRLSDGVWCGSVIANGTLTPLSSFKSCWCRSLHGTASSIESNFNQFSKEEGRASLHSLYTNVPMFWVNNPTIAIRLLENNKPYQTTKAHKAGLIVPDTLVSNHPDEIIEFCRKHGGVVACKLVSGHIFLHSGSEDLEVVYTQRISESDILERWSAIHKAPIIVQEYIPKAIELRVTIVWESIFCCAIHSQDSEKTKDDWRRYDLENVRHDQYDLPLEIKHKLLRFMRETGLAYAAIDMILTPLGEYVFLEVNQAGQWGWIEELTGMQITQAIADVLSSPPKRTYPIIE